MPACDEKRKKLEKGNCKYVAVPALHEIAHIIRMKRAIAEL
jgi:hypothetical protein